MRILYFVVVLFLSVTSTSSMAVETINEPHAMFYYQMSFGEAKSKIEQGPTFGFRVDRADLATNSVIDYQQILKRPAVFDFKMRNKSIEGIYVSGKDYLKAYRVHHADETSAEAETEPYPEEEGPSIGEGVSETVSEIGAAIDEMVHTVPFGVWIGIGLGIALAVGAS